MLDLPGGEGEVPLPADRRARQQPAQPPALQAARDPAGGLRDRPDPAPDRARGAAVRPRPAARARGASGSRSSSSRSARARRPPASASTQVELPEGSLIISVLRGGGGFVPKSDTVIEAGDEVLLILDPGLEADDHSVLHAATGRFRADGRPRVAHLLIGGGLASANCARWLRESGAEGEILLVGREPDPPYNRPPCSKGYLQGKESRESTYFRPDEWWGEQSIELLTRTSVMKLDTAAKQATLSTKEVVSYDTALLATGANVRRLQRRRRRAGGDPLPARVRQRRHDSCGRGREEGRADRRLLHRLRGRRVARLVRPRLLRDRDAGGDHARARLRRAGRALLPVAPGGAWDRRARRGRA